MLYTDPAFDHPLEAFYAYPGTYFSCFVLYRCVYTHSMHTHSMMHRTHTRTRPPQTKKRNSNPNPFPPKHTRINLITGIWALWFYRLAHVLWRRELPWVSRFVPRLVMSLVRYVTSVDIHPAAKISGAACL